MSNTTRRIAELADLCRKAPALPVGCFRPPASMRYRPPINLPSKTETALKGGAVELYLGASQHGP